MYILLVEKFCSAAWLATPFNMNKVKHPPKFIDEEKLT